MKRIIMALILGLSATAAWADDYAIIDDLWRATDPLAQETNGVCSIRESACTRRTLLRATGGGGATISRQAINWFRSRHMWVRCKAPCAGWAITAARSMAFLLSKRAMPSHGCKRIIPCALPEHLPSRCDGHCICLDDNGRRMLRDAWQRTS